MQVKAISETPCTAPSAAPATAAKPAADTAHPAKTHSVPDTIARAMTQRSPELSQLSASTAKASLNFLTANVSGRAVGYLCPPK